jgi:hypothetical protein
VENKSPQAPLNSETNNGPLTPANSVFFGGLKLGWNVRGIFPIPDGSHVNGVERSKSKAVIATGDDWGLVNLYNNPNSEGAKVNFFLSNLVQILQGTQLACDQSRF